MRKESMIASLPEAYPKTELRNELRPEAEPAISNDLNNLQWDWRANYGWIRIGRVQTNRTN